MQFGKVVHFSPYVHLFCFLLGLLLSVGNFSNAECILTVTQDPSIVMDVKLSLLNANQDELTGIWNGQDTWLWISLANSKQSRYNAILPISCIAQTSSLDETTRISDEIVNRNGISELARAAVVSRSYYHSRSDPTEPTDFFVSLDLSKAALVSSNSTVTIKCDVRSCIGLGADKEKCSILGKNFGTLRKGPVQRTRRVRDVRSADGQLPQAYSQARDTGNPVNIDAVCVTEAIFIALTTGMGLLLVMLIALNGILVYKTTNSAKTQRLPQYLRASATGTIPLVETRPITRASVVQRTSLAPAPNQPRTSIANTRVEKTTSPRTRGNASSQRQSVHY